ncbi:MAG: hypothetical protein AAFR59_05970, partial [Bacteroidota bacterium]
MKYISSFFGAFLLLFLVSHAQIDLDFPLIVDPEPVNITCGPTTSTPPVVSVNQTVRNQVVQGPCYIFATVAALESRAMESPAFQACTSLDPSFSEWSLYNTCVLGSKTGSASIMIPQVIDVALHEGLINSNAFLTEIPAQVPDPCVAGNATLVPNPCDPVAGGILDLLSTATQDRSNFCPGAPSDRVYIYEGGTDQGGTNYTDNEGNQFVVGQPNNQIKRFVIEADPNAAPYPAHLPPRTVLNGVLNYINLRDASINRSQKVDVLLTLLAQGYGCIALFDNWRDALNHCIFIYGGDGCTWDYKDSWPNEAKLDSELLDLRKLKGVYYVTGFLKEKGDTLVCSDYSLTGDEGQNPVNYTLMGDKSSICDYFWTIDGASIPVAQGFDHAEIDPSDCGSNPKIISVEIINSTSSCTITKTLQAPPAPDQVFIQG